MTTTPNPDHPVIDITTTPNAPPAPAQSPGILMLAPDGTVGYVPHENVASALSAGGKVGVRMTAPDGTKGVIPFDQQDAAQKKRRLMGRKSGQRCRQILCDRATDSAAADDLAKS